jgi:endonuclease YncB( thermonuclease family)
VILLIAAIVLLTQSGPATPNIARQGPLLVAEEVFTGAVVSVEDGDTVVVKAPVEQTTVHLAGLDAPEMSQSGGQQAKEFLTALIAGKKVTVGLTKVAERFARIELGGTDVTAMMIRAGMGWHCPRYSDDRELTQAEAEARAAKRGLWSVPQPTPPWLYRGAGACWQQAAKPRVSSHLRQVLWFDERGLLNSRFPHRSRSDRTMLRHW